MYRRFLSLLALLFLSAPTLAVDLENFWDARSERQGRKAIQKLLQAQVPVAELLPALRAGRPYSAKVPTGRQLGWQVNHDSQRHPYLLVVPASYDPQQRYPLRIVLHGGVNRPLGAVDGSWGAAPGAPEEPGVLRVYPAGWYESLWWEHSQLEAVAGILAQVRRTYNVDENRVVMGGVSDGGTGTWYFAMKDPTPYAAFLACIGHPGLLANPKADVEGEIHPFNLANRPFYVVNGGQDPLYPADSVQPFVEHFRKSGAEILFSVQHDSGHTMDWYASETPAINRWALKHPRDPLPDRLQWETADPDASGRISWLIIDRLGSIPGESPIPDANAWNPRQGLVLGLEADLETRDAVRVQSVHEGSVAQRAGIRPGDVLISINDTPTPTLEGLVAALKPLPVGAVVPAEIERESERLQLTLRYPPPTADNLLYPHKEPSGRVIAERSGNHFALQTEGVRALRLLLSPDEVDLSQPVVVEVNGRQVFSDTVEPDAETLLRWAWRDGDRTMLFVAELALELGSEPGSKAAEE
ncbi:MAG: PDZ domain-containing protein [Acidobacteriota bacterium]|nr:PDZ domain-containing protein [Acidobacteriota bacterium]